METKHQELMMDLSPEEMMEVHGGILPITIARAATIFFGTASFATAFDWVNKHWDDAKEGFKEGWEAGGK